MKLPTTAPGLLDEEKAEGGGEEAVPRRLPTRNEILSKCIDGGSVLTIIGAGQ